MARVRTSMRAPGKLSAPGALAPARAALKAVSAAQQARIESMRREASLRKKIALAEARLEREKTKLASAKAQKAQTLEERRRERVLRRVERSQPGDRAKIVENYEMRQKSGRSISAETEQVRFIQNVGKSLGLGGVSDELIGKIQGHLAGMTPTQFKRTTSTNYDDDDDEVTGDILMMLGIFSYEPGKADLEGFLEKIGLDPDLADDEDLEY